MGCTQSSPADQEAKASLYPLLLLSHLLANRNTERGMINTVD